MKSFEVLPEEHAHLVEKAFWYNALNWEASVLKNDVKPPDFISASQRRFGSASGSQPRRWEKTDSFANVIYFTAFFSSGETHADTFILESPNSCSGTCLTCQSQLPLWSIKSAANPLTQCLPYVPVFCQFLPSLHTRPQSTPLAKARERTSEEEGERGMDGYKHTSRETEVGRKRDQQEQSIRETRSGTEISQTETRRRSIRRESETSGSLKLKGYLTQK